MDLEVAGAVLLLLLVLVVVGPPNAFLSFEMYTWSIADHYGRSSQSHVFVQVALTQQNLIFSPATRG